ncbi:hypothetical protein Slin15195_G067800 [Septoria linicola]|uniref:BTB domain-containing protein n=1 Tax=Septoria linicola TaxID=215465 RepID=A0A9Q9EJ57_9PEZI|nr:hypothetical protein Slin14017_G100540 [Septoria linicola]USW53461.1 hypothetical protein Slin15195_G067800 [Septoria linicola]
MAQYGMPTLSPLARRAKDRRSSTPGIPSPAVAHTNKKHALAGTAVPPKSTGLPPTTIATPPNADHNAITKDAAHTAISNLAPSVEAPESDADGVVVIEEHGDLVLHMEHRTSSATLAKRYRVSTVTLKTRSRYFLSLLDGRFGESAKIDKQHAVLRQQYVHLSKAPSSELPSVHIEDIGRISAVKSIDALCTDFLLILHGKDTVASLPVANLANLAILADRFDALETVREHAMRKKLMRAIDGKTTTKAELGLTEERMRQRLLVGILLDHAQWMDRYSARLIMKGWVGKEAEESDAMWWSLPQRLEEELLSRREYILDMLQSSIAQFVALYTSRERQCRLGYDSSAACDSFQLGEMIRFLSRTGILQVKGMLFDAADPPEPYEGDIMVLIEALRQVPEYQIDRNHSHCGIRGRLIAMLNMVTDALHHVGICAECWTASRHEHSWIDAKRPLLWHSQTYRSRGLGHKEMHAQVRSMFMATERDWR